MLFLSCCYSFSAFCWFGEMLYFPFFICFAINCFADLFVLVSQLLLLALQGPNLSCWERGRSGLREVAQLPQLLSMQMCPCLHLSQAPAYQQLYPQEEVGRRITLPYHKWGCHLLRNTFSPLDLKVTKSPSNFCLLHIQSAMRPYLLFCSPFCFSILVLDYGNAWLLLSQAMSFYVYIFSLLLCDRSKDAILTRRFSILFLIL